MKREDAVRRFGVLRGKTRDFDVIEICDIMLGLLSASVAKEQQQQKSKFDRAAYMKGYMRKYREKKRKEGE